MEDKFCRKSRKMQSLPCRLDLNLAFSGCKFGVDRRIILQALLRRPQLELCPIIAVIAKRRARANERASQAHLHGFSSRRQTYVPKAPNSSPIHIPLRIQLESCRLPNMSFAARSKLQMEDK